MSAPDIKTGQVIPAAVAERDRALRGRLAESAELYAQAVLAEDWRSLGFTSVEAWSADVLGSARLTVEARRRVAGLLSAEGQTVRAIAAATGVDSSTAARDAKAVPHAKTRARAANRSTTSPRQRAARGREERKRAEENARLADRVREEAEHAFLAGIPPEEQVGDAVHVVAGQLKAEAPEAPEADGSPDELLGALGEVPAPEPVADDVDAVDLQARITGLLDQLEAADAELTSVKRARDELQGVVAAQQAKITNLEGQVWDLNRVNEGLRGEIRDLKAAQPAGWEWGA
jgi:hypothetical protein